VEAESDQGWNEAILRLRSPHQPEAPVKNREQTGAQAEWRLMVQTEWRVSNNPQEQCGAM
jgi:hypothetical protein